MNIELFCIRRKEAAAPENLSFTVLTFRNLLWRLQFSPKVAGYSAHVFITFRIIDQTGRFERGIANNCCALLNQIAYFIKQCRSHGIEIRQYQKMIRRTAGEYNLAITDICFIYQHSS